MDYMVPALPIDPLGKRTIPHVCIGLLRTKPGNPFLQDHYDLCLSHDESHIVLCHFGCLLHMISGRKTNEVGNIDLDAVEPLWRVGLPTLICPTREMATNAIRLNLIDFVCSISKITWS
jgi:hypothetical protein